jgi:LPS export ABC transporter protein LptC
MRKVRRSALLLVIFLSLGGVAYKVAEIVRGMQHEIRKNPRKILDYLPESALHMKDFHRAKVENGRKIWELFGDEANYYKDQKEAVIKKPRFYYYDQKGETIETVGDQARLFLNDKELERMELSGGVQVTFQGYVLKSEQANYLATKDQIELPTRTTVTGEGMELEGSRMEVEMEAKKIRLITNVKTKMEPEKLANKNKGNGRQRVGG